MEVIFRPVYFLKRISHWLNKWHTRLFKAAARVKVIDNKGF